MREIQAESFGMTEAVLYLDVYPHSTAAMAYYQRCRRNLARLTAAYEEHYGPLTAGGDLNDGATPCRWRWSTEPWPWEMEE